MLIALDDDELTQAGHMAEDVFVRQMRKRRAALDLSQAELASRIAKLGGGLYQQTIAKIESGQRAVRLQEADLIAQALGSTVSEMLALSIGDQEASPDTIDVDELITQVKALQRQREAYRERLQEARAEAVRARDAVHIAQQQEAAASMQAHRTAAQLEAVERELNQLTRISLERQSELNAKYGPRWREKMRIHEPITREWLLEQNRLRLDELRDLAESTKPAADFDREKLLKAIKDLEKSLELQGDEEE